MAFPLELLTLQNLLLRFARFLLVAAVSLIALLNRACDRPEKEFFEEYVSESRPYSSLVQVPVQFVIGLIKERMLVTQYSSFLEKSEGRFHDSYEEATSPCAVCLALVNGSDEVRELSNCSHIFQRECLDGCVDQGRITCPLCRSKLWPDLNNGKSKSRSMEEREDDLLVWGRFLFSVRIQRLKFHKVAIYNTPCTCEAAE